MKRSSVRAGEIFVTVVMAVLLLFGTALLVYGVRAGDEPAGPTASLSDWIGSLSTLAGFGAASIAAVYAARVVGIEHQRDRRRQAALVAVWLDKFTTLATETTDGTTFTHGVNGADLLLRNASDVPVTGVQVRVLYDGGPKQTGEVHVIHGEWNLAPPSTDPHPVPLRLAPGTFVSWSDLRVVQGEQLSGRCHVELSFIDSQGVRWMRTALGVLKEVPIDHRLW